MELFLEQLSEAVPVGVVVAGSSLIIFIVVGWCVPVFVMKVDPPVLHGPFEVRGGKYHHERWHPQEVLPERFKVCQAVPEESFNIVVLPFEGSWDLHEDQLDP